MESVQDVIKVLRRAKKVLVIAGAGISVSCGIPDFRSKDGIYEMVKHMDFALPEPECLFHIDYFREDPTPFFQVVQNVFAHSPQPSTTHFFLKSLQDQGKLLRLYSQNIDGLEEVAGVTRYIPCHGSFAWSSCMRCQARVRTQSVLPVIQAGVIPTCSELNCRGVLKPEVTFFGEILSDAVSTSITKDRLEADLILVLGTSLKVSPVAEIPSFVPRHIPQVVINKTPLKKKKLKTDREEPQPFDLQLLGDCDTIVRYLSSKLGWELDRQLSEPTSTKSPPRMIAHKNSRRVCFGECECEGVADGEMKRKTTSTQDDSVVEAVVCDGCGETAMEGAPLYHCVDCFDYDLCATCFADGSERHFGGNHEFRRLASR
ncbi:hypothetical protein ATCC90586_005560 [Pythium insidiosum]|nr:hypothetical protein ATCC90586_005560 [Pythium insidiosum]